MKTIFNFMLLDIKTIKPYLKSSLLYFAIGVATAVIGAPQVAVTFLLSACILTVLYPFAISEKNDIDILYSTLPLERKHIVFGRYLTSFVVLLVASISVFIAFIANGLINSKPFSSDYILISAGFFVAAIINVLIQYPIVFKKGYTKSRMLALLPTLIMVIGLNIAMPVLSEYDPQLIVNFIGVLTSNFLLVCAGVIIITVLAAVLSIRLSLKIYNKKDLLH